MQLKHLLPGAMALMLLATACTKDDDDITITLNLAQTEIQYNADGVWANYATCDPVQSQYINFSHFGEAQEWGDYWTGFTPARCSDTKDFGDPRYLHPFEVMPAGGVNGNGTPYLVAYWDTMETENTPLEERSLHITYGAGGVKEPFTPQSVYLTNTCYCYYSMELGDAYAAPFKEGDKFTLTAHGVRADGSETSVDLLLADCQGNKANWILKDWKKFDLSGLGEVTDIYFTMSSTDTGALGMNTPAYFAMDKLQIVAKLPQEM